ncbi:YqjF family protein [Halorubrum xinjiangense]|uniref:YqjF family protein n=1 Tax=Halorubrum xinjiangense TaxID=261291 RepID=UPI003C6F2EE6
MLGRRWLEMTWRDGLFAHWPVDPSTVAAALPDGLSVATHDGDAYLGVVPFVMDDIRPRGMPTGLSFPELNLRTYVEGPNGPGVYFHSLDADDRIGVAVARGLFRLPYYRAETDVRRTATDGEFDTVRFASRRVHEGAPHARFDATYAPVGEAFTPDSGSLPAFLLENYRFYTAGSGGRLYVGEIDHEPWTLRPAEAEIRANTLFAANGFEAPDGEPILHYAEPLSVTADRIRRV